MELVEDEGDFDVPITKVTKDSEANTFRRVMFGFGYLSKGIQEAITTFFQSVFFLEIAQIPAVWVGNILIVKQVWDGAIDPLIGICSDNFSTRFGRRKPWMFLFIWISALLWIAMWTYPKFIGEETWARILYFCVAIILYSTFTSFVFVPYDSLVPDMSNSYHTRTFVVMVMQICLFVGTGSASFLWSEIIQRLPTEENSSGNPLDDKRKGFFFAACIMAVPIIIAVLIAALAAKERSIDASEKVKSKGKIHYIIFQHLKSVVNVVFFPPFLTILGFSIVSLVATTIFTNNLILWLQYVYERKDITPQSLLILQGTIVVFLFVWALISRFIGKIPTYLIGSLFLIGGMATMYTIESSTEAWVFYLALVLCGIGTASGYLVLNSILPDVVSINENLTGKRREAVFYSFYGFVGKVSQGIAQLGATYALAYYGYLNPKEQQQQGNPGQPDEVILAIRIFVSFCPIVLRILGMLCAVLYYFVKRTYEKKLENPKLLEYSSKY